MGDFSLHLDIAYQVGAARGEYSTLSAMGIRDADFFAAFGGTINALIMGHRPDLEQKREAKCIALKLDRRWLDATSATAGPKSRWVDGTPEYSFHICGLRKLFPEALFVHVVRDVSAVVRSMVNFHHTTGIQLVRGIEEAYQYWTRAVKACLTAERAYGSAVVHRVHYADLVGNREATLCSLLEFLQEPYSDRCLEPLDIRINSSDVPTEFQINENDIDPNVVSEARQLFDEIEQSSQPVEASPAAAEAIEIGFRERATYLAKRKNAHQTNQRVASSVGNSGMPSRASAEGVAPLTRSSADE